MLENKPRRQFSKDFKIRAVELLLNGDRTVKSVAREIGVDPSSLRNLTWEPVCLF
ncbi:transposase [candidate division KSB1 bacterium]|nr:transposase [candidate division KSB1 bacterium]